MQLNLSGRWLTSKRNEEDLVPPFVLHDSGNFRINDISNRGRDEMRINLSEDAAFEL
jgi:hypothetical protein